MVTSAERALGKPCHRMRIILGKQRNKQCLTDVIRRRATGVPAEPHPVQVKAGKRREGYPHLLNYQLFTHRRFPYKMYPRLMRQQLWPINAWQHSAADDHRGLLHWMIGLDVYTAARTSDSAMLATVP